MHIVVVGHPVFAVDGYFVVGGELLLQYPCTQRLYRYRHTRIKCT